MWTLTLYQTVYIWVCAHCVAARQSTVLHLFYPSFFTASLHPAKYFLQDWFFFSPTQKLEHYWVISCLCMKSQILNPCYFDKEKNNNNYFGLMQLHWVFYNTMSLVDGLQFFSVCFLVRLNLWWKKEMQVTVVSLRSMFSQGVCAPGLVLTVLPVPVYLSILLLQH